MIDHKLLSPSISEDLRYLLSSSRCGSLLIDVIDHGPGMGQEEMSRLFQEGVQFNPNQLQAGQGSGLGLWISKGIVELHLGRLTAHSDGLGQGSTFTIEIPLFELSQSTSPQEDENLQGGDLERGNVHEDKLQIEEIEMTITSPKYEQIPCNPTTPCPPTTCPHEESKLPPDAPQPPPVREIPLRKILLVDDTPTNRKMVRRILRSDGYTDVDEAKDGLECVEMVSTRPPSEAWYDLILMDYEMPRMNGPDATSRLRELGYTMPIIGVTGNILSADITFFMNSGVNAVLPKPIAMKDLYVAYTAAITNH